MGRYQVDTLPRHLWPFFQAYSFMGATALTSFASLARHTCDWKVETSDGTTSIPYSGACIHCTWHENVPAYFAYYFAKHHRQRNKRVWLQHPAAYMLPIHKYLEWNDVDCVLGSSGHGGQEAMELLISRMQQEDFSCNSSAFFPDGPSGPVHRVKPGVVQVAQATGLPIVPIRFQFESSFRTGWDQKHFCTPYSTVHIQEMDPIMVSAKDDPLSVTTILEEALNSSSR